MASSSSQGRACSSSSVGTASILYGRLHQWEETLRDVSHAGCAESEPNLVPNTKIYVEGGRIYYLGVDNKPKRIKNLNQITSRTMHFKHAKRAQFAKPNSLDIANIEALTRAIYYGEIRVVGDYSCVNHLGRYPSDAAQTLPAETPVPVKL